MGPWVLGIAGSLRKGSYNKALLRAAAAVRPTGMELEIAEIGAIPPYDADVQARGFPHPVEALRQAAAQADAVLFATPEYNRSIPGVLKNAIDWISRPPDQPLAGKPGAIIGASTGAFGTVRAQSHLQQVCAALDMHMLNRPGVFVAHARDKFDADGNLLDEPTQERLAELLQALAGWTLRIGGNAGSS